MARTRGSKSGASAPKVGKKRVAFALHAPHAREAAVAGTFNDWDAEAKPMHPLGDGRWLKETVLPPGTYEYRLVVDGQWIADPLASESLANPFGGRNSILKVAARPTPPLPAEPDKHHCKS